MSAKIIIGDLSGVEKKGYRISLPADEELRESGWPDRKIREWNRIPDEAVVTEERVFGSSVVEVQYTWYEITP